jgi:DNA-binding CsgD family transcriptional regulator
LPSRILRFLGNRMTIEPLSDIILAIYESAFGPGGWFKALRKIADFSGSAGCRIVIQNNLFGPVMYSVEDGVESQSAGIRLENSRTATAPESRIELVPIGQPLIRRKMLRQVAITGSGEPWRGKQVSDAMTILLLDSSEGSIILETMKARGCYAERELEGMRLISPHVCRAIRISENLSASRLTSEMLEASLEVLSTGVYFIGKQSRIVYLNRVARSQVKSGTVLRLVGDHLVATDRGAQKLLQAELTEIESDTDLNDRLGRAVPLADGAGSGFVAQVLPLGGATQARIANHFAAIAAIFVQDPATAPTLANAAFARLYGLTDGELRLLNGLMPGLSLAEAARPLGISEATAKTHLRRIFAKTKTSKQAELLFLLMTSTPPTITA